VSKGGFSVLPSIGVTEESKLGGDDSHIVFGQKFPSEKGSVKRCLVVMQQPDVDKVRDEIFAHITQSP
jgi:hypothetical protein